MPGVDEKYSFTGNIEKVFNGIRQYELYPDYLPGVTEIESLEPSNDKVAATLKYTVNLVKKFHYTLDLYEEKPNRIYWTLVDSNLMKKNDGSWQLTADGDKTNAEYHLDLKFKGLVPGKIQDMVAKTQLPAMFEGFQKLINDHG